MTLPTRTLTAVAYKPSGAPIGRLYVQAVLTKVDFTTEGMVVEERVRVATNASGVAQLQLWPNTLGTQGSQYRISTIRVVGNEETEYDPHYITMPDADSDLQVLVGDDPGDPAFASGAAISADLAQKRALLALRFASEAEDVEVVDPETETGTGLNSSLHHAAKAATDAQAASDARAGAEQVRDELEYLERVVVADAALTVTAAHLGKLLRCTNAGGCVLTLPETATEALPDGFWFLAKEAGGGPVVFQVEGAEVLEVRGGADRTSGLYAVAGIVREADGVWTGGGDVTTP